MYFGLEKARTRHFCMGYKVMIWSGKRARLFDPELNETRHTRHPTRGEDLKEQTRMSSFPCVHQAISTLPKGRERLPRGRKHNTSTRLGLRAIRNEASTRAKRTQPKPITCEARVLWVCAPSPACCSGTPGGTSFPPCCRQFRPQTPSSRCWPAAEKQTQTRTRPGYIAGPQQ